jgi:predicted AlkP superfamily phosphohydrolase/phosphomutase
VTPITAADLGRLLKYTVEYGAIPVTKLRDLFSHYSPNAVTAWVETLEDWLTTKRPLSLDIFIKALEHLKGKVPDVLSASTVALICREQLKKKTVKDSDVIALVRGLSILIPDLVGIDNDKIVVNASAEKVAEAVRSQLEKLHQVESGTAEGGEAKT